MFTRFRQIDNVNDLREYINETLCDRYQLQCGAFQMTEQVLVRAGKPCGIYFCLSGPRLFGFQLFGRLIAIKYCFTVLRANVS